MAGFLISFVVSVCMTLLLVRSAKVHAHHSGDRDFSKPQKFHDVAVPRIGGLAIVVGLFAAAIVVAESPFSDAPSFGYLLLACATPAFAAGLVQDFTEAVPPSARLLATGMSAVLAFYAMGGAIAYTAIPGLDWVVGFSLGSLAVTVFTVAGIANAINIIDGFNGLASMCVMLMLAAVSYVAFQVGDSLIGLVALAGIGAVLGFFVWNFPSGLIFLGDGGAYFLGFLVAEISILLLARNPGVSPMFPLLVCIYPAFETLFSVYRRWVLRQQPAHMPDGIHLHSLVYRRVMRWAMGKRGAKLLTRRNSMTSPVLWVLCMMSVVPALLFWDNTLVLSVFLFLFVTAYVLLYWSIVRFRSPRWLHTFAGRSRPVPLGAEDNEGT